MPHNTDAPIFYELKDFCLNPPRAEIQIFQGPTNGPSHIEYHRFLIERHIRYRLLQVAFVCSVRIDVFKIPTEARLGLHYGCYRDSRPRFWLLNCVASDLHCSSPDNAEDAAMETLTHVIDYFVLNGQLPIHVLEGVHYEVPMNPPQDSNEPEAQPVMARARPH